MMPTSDLSIVLGGGPNPIQAYHASTGHLISVVSNDTQRYVDFGVCK